MEQRELKKEIKKAAGSSILPDDPPASAAENQAPGGSALRVDDAGSKSENRVVLDAAGEPAERSSGGSTIGQLRRDAAERLGDLTEDTERLITQNPWGAALSAFGIGLTFGLVVGVLVGRD